MAYEILTVFGKKLYNNKNMYLIHKLFQSWTRTTAHCCMNILHLVSKVRSILQPQPTDDTF